MPDLLGEEVAVLCVKGSGSDMATVEPPDLPAVRLDRLRKLRTRAALSDEEMVRIQRESLLEPTAPNPSVETLLHAFLPHKFGGHTHLARRMQPQGRKDRRGVASCDPRFSHRSRNPQFRQWRAARALRSGGRSNA